MTESENFIIDVLKEKYAEYQSKWDYDDSNDNNVLISPDKSIAIEWTDYGMYRVTHTQSQLTLMADWNGLLAGHTFTIYKVWEKNDWYKFQLVYLEGTRTNNFRIDIPINRLEFEFNDTTWEYTHIMRPGTGIGQSDLNFYDKDQVRIKADLNNMIDQFYYLIESMILVSTDKLIPPTNCQYALRDAEGFYFTKGFRGWSQPPKKIIQSSLMISKLFLISLNADESFINEWLTTATAKWETLYEL